MRRSGHAAASVTDLVQDMKRLIKVSVVLAGYVAALLGACAASYVRGLLTPNDPASGGMQAFTDVSFFLAVLFILALVPTAVALWFLRRFEKLWTAFAVASLAVAATGPVAASPAT